MSSHLQHSQSWYRPMGDRLSMRGLELRCDYSFEQPTSALCEGIGIV